MRHGWPTPPFFYKTKKARFGPLLPARAWDGWLTAVRFARVAGASILDQHDILYEKASEVFVEREGPCTLGIDGELFKIKPPGYIIRINPNLARICVPSPGILF